MARHQWPLHYRVNPSKSGALGNLPSWALQNWCWLQGVAMNRALSVPFRTNPNSGVNFLKSLRQVAHMGPFTSDTHGPQNDESNEVRRSWTSLRITASPSPTEPGHHPESPLPSPCIPHTPGELAKNWIQCKHH